METGPRGGVSDPLVAASAMLQIQQLPIRYAFGVDSRDLDMIAEVYVPDIDCGRWGRGREALVRMYHENDATMGVTIHRVSNHLIDLVDEDNATGVVYLDAEHQQHDGSWARLKGAYHDTYVRLDGRWYFSVRKLLFWYRDTNTLPSTTARDMTYRVFSKWPTLPDAWPTWQGFWAEHGDDEPVHRSVQRSMDVLSANDGDRDTSA